MNFIAKTLCLSLLLLAEGCATWTFTPLRTRRFVDDVNNYVLVDYGEDEKAEYSGVAHFSWGGSLPFKTKEKVRVELPDGDRFVAYRHLSERGNLYRTKDGEWEFFEEGVACIVARRIQGEREYRMVYQGVLCAAVRNPLNEKKASIRSGAPQGFGRDSEGPRDSSGPRTAK